MCPIESSHWDDNLYFKLVDHFIHKHLFIQFETVENYTCLKQSNGQSKKVPFLVNRHNTILIAPQSINCMTDRFFNFVTGQYKNQSFKNMLFKLSDVVLGWKTVT